MTVRTCWARVSASPHGTDGHGPETGVPQLTRRPRARAAGRRIRDRIGRRSRLIAVLLSASLVYVIVDIFVQGPLTQLDIALVDWDGETSIPSLERAAWVYDKLGQRSVLVPILLIVAGVFARRHRTWRPVVLAAMSFLVLNVVVGAMKIVIGRSETETGNPDVLAGGIIFPSGHSSNMVLTGGVIVYLLLRYAEHPPVRAASPRCGPCSPSLTIAHQRLHRQPLADRPDRRRAGRRPAAAVGHPVRHRDGRRPLHPAVVVAPDGRRYCPSSRRIETELMQ